MQKVGAEAEAEILQLFQVLVLLLEVEVTGRMQVMEAVGAVEVVLLE